VNGIEYLDHAADAAIRVRGRSLHEVFCRAARGLFSLMLDVDRVAPRSKHDVSVEAPSLEALLVEWLADLLAQKDLSELVFGRFDVSIDSSEGGYRLRGAAWGEPLDAGRHERKLEVKGISYLGLRVARDDDGWLAECVFDV